MFQEKYYVRLSSQESQLVAQSLIRLKNALIRQGRYTDCVDELIIKILGNQIY